MEQPDHIYNLIASALSGEATPEQLRELELWKQAGAENMDFFRSMEKLMTATETIQDTEEFDTDRAWIKLKKSIDDTKSPGTIRQFRSRIAYSGFLRIAAMLFLFAGISFAVYKLLIPSKAPIVVVESGTTIREFKLPDSTGIVLNRNSKITYAFSNKKRSIELQGEAFFDLASDPKRPFEVKAAGVIIRDIGTSFNVKAPEGNDTLIVNVTGGEVMMSSEKGQSVVLKKGESAVYLKSRDEFIRQAISDTNATSYLTKIFVFENATLNMVTEKVSDVYGINLVAAPAVGECHITVTFKNASPDKIIDIIAETLQLTVKRENNSIILDGTDCGQ